MDERLYRLLRYSAIALTIAWVGWTLYDSGAGPVSGTEQELAAAVRYLEDGQYQEALEIFSRIARQQPDNIGALRGRAQALMRMGLQQAAEAARLDPATQADRIASLQQQAPAQLRQSLALYDQAIAQEAARGLGDENRRAQGVALANRGILKDQLGDYAGALDDYRAGLRLEPALAEGPGLLTRFLRNQAERPPSIADRARYIAEQLAKPAAERLLRLPEQDMQQRPYRLD